MRFLLAAALLLFAVPALAQNSFSRGGMANNRTAAQRWMPDQQLNVETGTAPRSGTVAADRLARSQRQAELGQSFSATGLPRNVAPPQPGAPVPAPGSAPPRR